MKGGDPDRLPCLLGRLSPQAAERFAPILRVTTTESTNTAVWDRLGIGAPDGTVLLAQRQVGGRGRLGRSWASPAGNLHLSVLRRIREPVALTGIFSLLCGVALCQAVEELCGLRPVLKWPNDLLVGEKKLAGILLEGRLPWQVAGIGLNVNTTPADLPVELREIATSLLVETGQRQDMDEIAARFLARLHPLEESFVENPVLPRELFLAWFPFVGTLVSVQYGGRVLEAPVAGVGEDGALLLSGKKGETIRISAGEVTHAGTR